MFYLSFLLTFVLFSASAYGMELENKDYINRIYRTCSFLQLAHEYTNLDERNILSITKQLSAYMELPEVAEMVIEYRSEYKGEDDWDTVIADQLEQDLAVAKLCDEASKYECRHRIGWLEFPDIKTWSKEELEKKEMTFLPKNHALKIGKKLGFAEVHRANGQMGYLVRDWDDDGYLFGKMEKQSVLCDLCRQDILGQFRTKLKKTSGMRVRCTEAGAFIFADRKKILVFSEKLGCIVLDESTQE